MNKLTIQKAIQMINEGKVIQESENTWRVKDYILVRKTLPGRTLLTCPCRVQTRYCNSNGLICSHQCAVILHEAFKYFGNQK